MSRRGGGRRGGGGAAGGRGDFPRDPNPVPGGGRGRGDPSHAPAQQRGGGGGGRGDFYRDPNQASGGGRGRVEMSGGGPSYAPAPAQQRGGAVGGGGGRGDPQRGPNPVPGGGRGRGDLPGGAPYPAPEQPRGGGRGGRGRGLPVAGRGGDQLAAAAPPQQTLTPADQASSSSPAAAAALAEQVERRLAISDPPPPAAPAAAAAIAPAATALVPATPPPESSKSVRYPARPGFGTIGRKMVVRANHFLVKVASNMDYCHYDVAITPEVTSRGVNRAIMKELITLYGESHLDRKKPAYDGRKSLYTAGELPFQSKNFVVKLPDKDKSSTRPEKTFKVAIKFAARHDLHHLEQFLKGRQMDCPQETIQVLDVVMRESPSTNYTTVARSFFSPLFGNKEEIGEGMECWRGYYQSLRPTQMGLSLNIDIAATSFYKAIPVIQFISEYLNLRDTSRPLSDNDRIKVKKALRGLRVDVTHTKRRYKVAGITPAPLGQLLFPVDDKGTQMSVVQYFKEKYNYPLRQLNWPCIQSGSDSRPTYLPFEVCKIAEGQRFTKKLNDRQVTKILRLACKRPPEREKNILEMVQRNDYSKDEFAREFGIGVEDRLTQVQARVLPPPKLKYHETGREKSCSPSVGQWNMINKRMVNGGTIGTWTCLNLSRLRPDVVGQFCYDLVALGNNIGMSINPNPLIPPRGANPANIEGALRDVKNQCSEALARQGITGKSLQLLIIVLPEMNSPYGKIKRICETDLGIVSQCCLPRHVGNYNKQYLENISLKINVKVGGRNTVLEDALRPRAIPFLNDRPTIIFGADVTHPPPGDDSLSSIAAVVASMDWPEVSKYRCLVSAQTHREEMIQDLYSETRDPQKGIIYGGMVREHLLAFHRSTNRKPERILFYRDGVSEGQFSHVLLHEMDQIRRACTSIQHDYLPPVTFVVVQKRHHTRLFPAVHGQRDSTDRSGNILPGTVVDTTICHPVEFDFYLCSHAGIQGTSRPTHYHVLFDENKFSADALQTLTNNLCYTYARCTRSVSVVPPAYYAHLAAFRARYYVEDESDIDSSAAGGSNLRNKTLIVRTLPKVKENVKEVMFYC